MTWIAIGSAIWLGILTAISPCPMATNIAAIATISRRLQNPGATLTAGLLYALGRGLAYLGVAAMVVWGLLSLPALSQALQTWLPRLIGPLLIITGMILVGLLRPTWAINLVRHEDQQRLGHGWWWPFVFGVLFALSFCPLSAVIFFGQLIPLATQAESPIVLPLLYGIATALPVVVIAGIALLGMQALARSAQAIQKIAPWLQWISGGLILLIGIWLSLTASLGL